MHLLVVGFQTMGVWFRGKSKGFELRKTLMEKRGDQKSRSYLILRILRISMAI